MKLSAKQNKTYNPHSVRSLTDLAKLPDDYHAVLAPSSMGRVLKCPASVQESLSAPVKEPSEAAQRGSRLHEVTEQALTSLFKGSTIEEIESILKSTIDDANEVQQVMFCIDEVQYIMEHIKDKGHTISYTELEKTGSLVDYDMPFIHGTADLKIATMDQGGKITIYIRDWKFGFVEVYTKTDNVLNAQLHLYGIMQIGDADFLNLGIVQPAHSYRESATISREESLKWLKNYFEPVIIEAMGDNARFNPGESQCRFCPAALTCRERFNFMQILTMQLQDASERLPSVVMEELVQLHLKSKSLKKYISSIEKFLLTTALAEGGVPHLKAVNGRGRRKFKDLGEAESFMLDHGIDDADLYKSALISPAQAEALNRKLKKDEAWKNIINIKPGNPQLVLENDKRDAITPEGEAKRAFHNHIEGD